ncbi:aspartyl protease family protein [Novosphingobium piscinae]|uniref:Aspartyl protease family protein n=2 Tax=Novosphingobium piscinae TaxID=1507448 RepID=A0A7X1G118_9SPHN|nr:aspartyl protease family protein [Novosphingobium piscinae]
MSMNPTVLVLPLLAAAIGAPLLHAPAAKDSADTEVIAVTRDSHARMTVPVRIGTAGPFRFLLDTGSQNTVVSSDLATRLALPAERRARLVGVAGTRDVQTVLLDEVALGRRSYYGLTAPVLEQRHIGADGIVGLDSLQDQRVLIDFTRQLIAVSDAKSLGGNAGFEIVVSARSRSGQLIMTDATIDGVRTAVVIDTGAEISIGNMALLAALGRKGAQLERTMLEGVTGHSLPAELAVAKRLQIQRLEMTRAVIAFVDAPPFAALKLDRKPAILLGMRELRAFRRVAIDFQTRRILFDMPDTALGPLPW